MNFDKIRKLELKTQHYVHDSLFDKPTNAGNLDLKEVKDIVNHVEAVNAIIKSDLGTIDRFIKKTNNEDARLIRTKIVTFNLMLKKDMFEYGLRIIKEKFTTYQSTDKSRLDQYTLKKIIIPHLEENLEIANFYLKEGKKMLKNISSDEIRELYNNFYYYQKELEKVLKIEKEKVA
jgi:hypothetical protein